MRHLIIALFWLTLAPLALAAQTPNPPAIVTNQSGGEKRAQGFVFFGPGATSGSSSTFVNFGGGGEGFLKGGLSVSGEIAGYTPAKSFDEGFGILSGDAGYHFLKASQSGKLVPFVSGGYSLFFRSETANGINFGGGVNYWLKDHIGLRFEIRDHLVVESPDTHFIGFRFGMTFR